MAGWFPNGLQERAVQRQRQHANYSPRVCTEPASAQVTNGRAWLLTGSGCQRGRASPSLLLGRHLRHANGMGTREATGGREGGGGACDLPATPAYQQTKSPPGKTAGDTPPRLCHPT